MDQLFNLGRGMLKNALDGNNNNQPSGQNKERSSSSLLDAFEGINPSSLFQQLDRNGDGKVTVEGSLISDSNRFEEINF
jgi:hypothetical protein